jgi:hypothetical protein
MPTTFPAITADADVGFVNAAVSARRENRDFLAVSIFTLVGIGASLAFIVLFPVGANFAALALVAG